MSSEYNFKLSKSQGDLLAKAISILSFSIVVCFTFFVIYLLIEFTSKFSSILLPPVVAIILAMIFKPYYFWLYEKLWHIKWLAVTCVFLTILLPLGGFTYLFGALLVDELAKLISALPEYIISIYTYVKKIAPGFVSFLDKNGFHNVIATFDPMDYININAIASKVSGATISFGSYLANFFGSIFSWLVLPVYMAIFLTTRPYTGKDLSDAFIFLPKRSRDNLAYLVDQFLGIIVVYFRAQVLVALIQGVLFAILFHLLGLKYGLVIGIMLGILNIVPYLGNIIGWIVIIPLTLFGPDGGVWLLLKIFIAFCTVQTIDGYFITPRIMKDRTGLNTFVIIFSLFFWSSIIDGALGMILAIPLSAFIAVLWRLVKKEYFSEINDDISRKTNNQKQLVEDQKE